MRLKHFLLLSVLLSTGSLWAQIPSGYYDSAEGKTGQALRTALHNIIKGHTVISYDGLKSAYFYTDADANGKLVDIYSDYRWSSGQSCGNYSGEGDCWNREHTWPQSWFGSGNPKSDLFQVLPTDGYVNNRRSNYPYGEVSSATYTSKNGSKLGSCKTSGYSGTVFEPIDEYKGDIARCYFYMSTRYYTEDSNWGSSGMTNKCEIKDWAMTMLLRWHKEDPVSQKELDRNNVIYNSYQKNRNPFIDHPEYAEMIWDENWTESTSYNITSATNLSGGTVSAPYSALEGATVSITATPATGYEVSGYSAWKTGDTSTQVSVSSNGTFTMPGYAVTVSATFKKNTTQYSITLASVSNGSISASATSALSGTTITLTATPGDGYQLKSFYVYKNGDTGTTVEVSDNSFTMPAFNVTVSATFVEEGSSTGGTGDFVKVTSAPSDWSGEYLIVYEDGNLAFNGGLTELDAESNYISISISNNTIAATNATNAATFTITPMDGGYSIQAKSGKYIGWGSDSNNGLSSGAIALTNTISFNSGGINIIGSGGAFLRYNNNAKLFRYYKSSSYTNQKAIQLYKREVVAEPVYHTVTFNNNDGQTKTQTVEEFVATALEANTFELEGYVFDGWMDGDGNYYADGATVKLLTDLELWAQWDKLYTITCATTEHGSISASATTAVYETTIDLTATPEDGYQFSSWTITDESGNSVEVTDNSFEMPESDVTVSATFAYVGQQVVGETYYQLVTSADQLVAGKTYLIVNTEASKALSTTQRTNNRAATDVTINSDNTITTLGDACELTLGGSAGAWTLYDSVNSGYLYAASSSSNWLRTQSTNDANGTWSISISTDGTASITSQGTNTHNQLKYNNNSSNGNLFSCYASGQQPVSLFVRVEQTYNVGDVNKDGFITIADVTALVNIILGKDDEEPHQYNHVAADVNDDGSITIADVTALVNIILGKNN